MSVQLEDRVSLIGSLLHIDNKHREIIPFIPNAMQQQLLRQKGSRNIILKARQMGTSSILLADMFIECITRPNTTAVIVSHSGYAAERLLARVQFFHDLLPIPDDQKPVIGHESSYESTFPRMHSLIYIKTAESLGSIRGERVDKALLSEISRYRNPENVLNAMEEAVPLDSGELTLESTANGENNIFYDVWTKAREGKNGYIPFFFPWYICEEYQLPEQSPLALPADRGKFKFTEEERRLNRQFGLTREQLRWRRRKLADKGALFYQEYAEDEVSVWLQSGTPVFDPDLLADMATACSAGKRRPAGYYVWLNPKPNAVYVIGADCSAGVEGGSYSAASVVDEGYNVCATFQARLDPAQFANVLMEMGHYYNNAQVAVERNAQGYAVLSRMMDYSNLYFQRDYATGKQTDKLGWWTSEQTKNYLIATFRDMLHKMRIWDANLVRQARNYTYIKFKPTTQGHDDLLMATMIAVGIKQTQGTSRGFVGTAQTWGW